MVWDPIGLALLIGAPLLITITAIRYRRGDLSRERAGLNGGSGLVILANALLQATDNGYLPTETALDYVLGGMAVALLAAGLWIWYRWYWQAQDEQDTDGMPNW